MIEIGLTLKCTSMHFSVIWGTSSICIYILSGPLSNMALLEEKSERLMKYCNLRLLTQIYSSFTIYLLVIWWILKLLPHFSASPLECTGERASSPGPALPHQDVKVLAGIRAASSIAVLCVKRVKPKWGTQNLCSFPRFRRSLTSVMLGENSRLFLSKLIQKQRYKRACVSLAAGRNVVGVYQRQWIWDFGLFWHRPCASGI